MDRRFAQQENWRARALKRDTEEAQALLREQADRIDSQQARMEAWEVPPVCRCGAKSYYTCCSVCHRDLGPTYRCKDN